MPNSIIAFLRATGSPFWEQIAGWYQNSTLGELITYFKETWFTIHFGVYDNFTVPTQTVSMINKIIPALVWGLIIAAIATFFSRKTVGSFVGTLCKNEAFSPEAGMTLLDAGAFRSTVVRRELCRSAFLRKVVFCREEQAFLTQKGKDATYQIDFTKDHFYIPEDLKYRAENRFSQKGAGWLFIVLTVILVPLVVGILCRFMPTILQFTDSLITLLAP